MERALARYFARSAGRPTPFGLFAGCSFGRIGAKTALTIPQRGSYRRRTRLDSDYLAGLADTLAADTALRADLVYRPNSSLYRAGGRFRYAESRLTDGVRTHHLVAVEITDYLEATLRRAEAGARRASLAVAIAQGDAGVSEEEATRYVDELIDSQILVPDLAPPLTGEEPIRQLVQELGRHEPARHVAARLRSTMNALHALDQAGLGSSPARYRALARELEELPASVDLHRLFQVDMIKPSPRSTLGSSAAGAFRTARGSATGRSSRC